VFLFLFYFIIVVEGKSNWFLSSFFFVLVVPSSFTPWRWTRTHRSSFVVGDELCQDCPHWRVMERVVPRAPTSVVRQPFSNPVILGGGNRSSVVGGCLYPGNCRVHPSGCPSVRPVRVVRVRGDPPPMFVPRPYMRLPGRKHSPPRGLNGVSLFSPRLEDTQEALNYLLRNVGEVFDSYERCLGELDAWRAYFSSGK